MKAKRKIEFRESDYVTDCDRRTQKYGIRKAGHKGWWVEPQYEHIEPVYIYNKRFLNHAWVKQNGRYGRLDMETRGLIAPCEYGCLPYYLKDGYAEVWKDYKAGVINEKNEVVIPIIYDEIYRRWQRIDNPDQEKYVDEDGEEHVVGDAFIDVCIGFACFTNEGGSQAYDANMQPCEFEDWEHEHCLNYKYEWCFPENADRTVEEIEEIIRTEYRALLDMGYDANRYRQGDQIEEQKKKVKSYIHDRNHIVKATWVHDYEHAKKVMRVNELLMRAVAKAVKLGKRTAKSLQWMEKVSNRCKYEVEFYVHPEWENDKSSYDYKPKEKNGKKERERLEGQTWDAESHIWNIMAALSEGCITRMDNVSICFNGSVQSYEPENENDKDKWDFHAWVRYDTDRWDEGIHYPAYMDVYFTMPFYYLFYESLYTLADLVNINDFRVKVKVKLQTKESDKLP